MWTHFWDMHSGGKIKTAWAHIYIEAPIEQARGIFYQMFGRNPDYISCSCCGSDFSVSESDTIDQATEYQRGYRHPRMSVEEYVVQPEVKVVYAAEAATVDAQAGVKAIRHEECWVCAAAAGEDW
jgi:hypothetical protein